MDQVLRGLDFCYVYIDDVLIASHTPQEHKEHLRLVLQRFELYGILINPPKCVLGIQELQFLGHRVNQLGVSPLPDQVQVIRDFPQPCTLRQLRTFLGLVNFYHRFIPKCAAILTPLNALLKITATNSRALQWTPPATTAFNDIKEALANATLLVHPKPNAPLNVMTDASDVAIGAVLQQFLDDKWCPLSYFSRKLSPAEQRYSTFDRELLAVYCAIRHFRHFLEAREFHILTDHKPLTHSLQSKPDRHSPCQVRHLDFISQFTCDIRHVAGEGNPVADALSRLETNAVQLESAPPTVDFSCYGPELSQMLPIYNTCTLPTTLSSLLGSPCQCVLIHSFVTHLREHHAPTSLNSSDVQYSTHSIGCHTPSVRATLQLVTSRYFWPGMNADVRRWARSCLQCQKAKVTRHTVTPLGTFNTPDARFDHIHIDLVGPLPTSQ